MDIIKQCAEEITPGIILKPEQVQAITAVTNGNDVIVNLPVGFGKSMIFYVLPGLFRKLKKPEKVLVVSPLSAIMQEQVEKLKCLGIPAVQLSQNCKIPDHDNDKVNDAVHESKIIFAHPEALFVAEKGQEILHSLDRQISAIVIDECHKIDDWGKEFRKTFAELGKLRSFFPHAVMICLSATLTEQQQTDLIKVLALSPLTIININPDRPNLYLSVIKKGDNIFIENIYKNEIKNLKEKGCDYPVTLMFMPLQYMASAMQYAFSVFKGHVSLENSLFACLFSKQDKAVADVVLSDLQKLVPRFRLVFTTSVIGMGFDPPSIQHVIHLKPPRNLNNYFQEIGRAGRRGQISKAILYYGNADISKNLPGITDDIILYCKSESCLRTVLLKTFGFIKNEKSPVGCKCCNKCLQSCTCDDCALQQSLKGLNV